MQNKKGRQLETIDVRRLKLLDKYVERKISDMQKKVVEPSSSTAALQPTPETSHVTATSQNDFIEPKYPKLMAREGAGMRTLV